MLDIFVNVVGWVGTILILAAYALVTKRGTGLIYHLLNIVGSAGLMINAIYYHAIPGVALDVAWIGIASFGIWTHRTVPVLVLDSPVEVD